MTMRFVSTPHKGRGEFSPADFPADLRRALWALRDRPPRRSVGRLALR